MWLYTLAHYFVIANCITSLMELWIGNLSIVVSVQLQVVNILGHCHKSVVLTHIFEKMVLLVFSPFCRWLLGDFFVLALYRL